MNSLVRDNFKSPTSTEKKLDEAGMASLLKQFPDWRLSTLDNIARLERSFSFGNFSSALTFANRVGALADDMNHHPTMLIEWGKCTITWWTHSHGGLLHNDFIMAAETDRIFNENS